MKVIDASAVIAFWRGEPGSDRALDAFDGGALSVVNLGEVFARLSRDGVQPEAAKEQIDRFGLSYVPPSIEDVMDVGRISSRLGFSLGDKFCIALARRFGAPIVTADRLFAEVQLNVPVELIR